MKRNLWLKRMLLGGLIALAALLVGLLLTNVLVKFVTYGVTGVFDPEPLLTFDRCAYQFGSVAGAVAVEGVAVFLLGCAIGLATLPFAETWTSLLGLSLLHFGVTGGLSLLVGWSYCWFGFGTGAGPWLVLALYLAIYLVIWFVRWLIWYSELRQMRRALGLNRKER